MAEFWHTLPVSSHCVMGVTVSSLLKLCQLNGRILTHPTCFLSLCNVCHSTHCQHSPVVSIKWWEFWHTLPVSSHRVSSLLLCQLNGRILTHPTCSVCQAHCCFGGTSLYTVSNALHLFPPIVCQQSLAVSTWHDSALSTHPNFFLQSCVSLLSYFLGGVGLNTDCTLPVFSHHVSVSCSF